MHGEVTREAPKERLTVMYTIKRVLYQFQQVGMAKWQPQKVTSSFEADLGELQEGGIHLGLTGRGKTSLGTDWQEVLVVRDFLVAG